MSKVKRCPSTLSLPFSELLLCLTQQQCVESANVETSVRHSFGTYVVFNFLGKISSPVCKGHFKDKGSAKACEATYNASRCFHITKTSSQTALLEPDVGALHKPGLSFSITASAAQKMNKKWKSHLGSNFLTLHRYQFLMGIFLEFHPPSLGCMGKSGLKYLRMIPVSWMEYLSVPSKERRVFFVVCCYFAHQRKNSSIKTENVNWRENSRGAYGFDFGRC